MERSRIRTLVGIGLIVLGVIFLSQALARPMLAPGLPPLSALAPLPPLPAMPALPPLPALPALPTPHGLPFLHHRGWFSPPLVLLGLIVLAIVWHRRGTCAAAK